MKRKSTSSPGIKSAKKLKELDKGRGKQRSPLKSKNSDRDANVDSSININKLSNGIRKIETRTMNAVSPNF